MGNKSKKKKKNDKPVAPPLTDEQKTIATKRLTSLFKKISERPESILDMFYRLEIPWYRRQFDHLIDSDPEGTEYIIIRVKDLEVGEERNQSQGSIASRVYKEHGNKSSHGTVSGDSVDDHGNDDSNGNYVIVDSTSSDASKTVVAEADSEETEEEYESYLKGVQG